MRTFDGIMPVLSDADIDAIFTRFDLNGDGYMSIAEFDTFFRDAIDRTGTYPSTPTYASAPNYATPTYGSPSHYTAPVMPTYIAPPVEQPWETEVLDTVRSCLSVGRSGMTITEVFR